MDRNTLTLLASLTSEPKVVRETRNGRVSGADIRDIGELVNRGLIERHYETETTNRGTKVQRTIVCLSPAGSRFVASMKAMA